ncbi:MAG: ABC transporter substrate-binding protein [Thaumarchaeota archaeon]|nr:ABC transporter substrate-binding protein [Nitrososphaerota archaeon]
MNGAVRGNDGSTGGTLRSGLFIPCAAALLLALAVQASPCDGLCEARADGGATYVDSVRFVQYLDENTALEEVRGGGLDMYYYHVSSDQLESHQSRQGLNVHESTGGSYSILVNPAVSESAFNPFQDRDVRFALNYLIDRRLVVNELMGGYGVPIISHYGPYDPEYLTVIGRLAAFEFGYNPALAERLISDRMHAMGATRDAGNGAWMAGSEPVSVSFFIRSDDPVRKSIGEILASELERMGFVVQKEFGDLNKAFVVVYGSNPADLKWSLYTEGWAKSAFVRYDSTGLSQMYSPWFSNMPGFNDPSYWNYENDMLDNATQRIYTGDFEGEEERAELIRYAVAEGVSESVRIFIAGKNVLYVTHESVSGVVNDFGAGLPSRFTPINARMDSPASGSHDGGSTTEGEGELRIGVKQIYQGAWNPVMGFRDAYSSQIGTLLSDPAVFLHPYTGSVIPLRAEWNVTTAGPLGALDVAGDAILWDPVQQQWREVGPGVNATSMVTFRYALGNWHSGAAMDMLDIVHSLYFAKEWGTHTGPDDATFDTEFTSVAAPSVQTIKGIRPAGPDTVEVYVDYWHFDEGQIAQWASPGVSMPWEMVAAMEGVVTDGKASFSRSGAASKGIGWLSVIVPNDSAMIRDELGSMRDAGHVPAALAHAQPLAGLVGGPDGGGDGGGQHYFQSRYDSAISWIDDMGHAMVGNGPFYLDSYSPESRSIRLISFGDETYPFERGSWSGFERAAFPEIAGVDIRARPVVAGGEMRVDVSTRGADSVLYFVTSGRGEIVSSGTLPVTAAAAADTDTADVTSVVIGPGDTKLLSEGANTVRVFALSETVLRPDIYEAGFLAVSSGGADLGAGGGGDTDSAAAGIGSPDAPSLVTPTPPSTPPPPPPDAAADESSVPYAVAAGLAPAVLGAAVYWVRKRKTQASDVTAASSRK